MMTDVIRAGRFEIPVMHLDNHILVVQKPCNMPVQADSSGDDDLLSALKRYVGEKFNKPGQVFLGLVHRIDRPVGGVMVFARTSKAAERLSRDFAERAVSKSYVAVVKGRLDAERELEDYLVKDEKTGSVRVCEASEQGAKRALLRTTPMAFGPDTTLVRVELFTGRAHQIRVQHAHAGYPLWGDNRYGGGRPGEQIALWAYQLMLTHPTLKEEMTFRSLPPKSGAWAAYERELEALP